MTATIDTSTARTSTRRPRPVAASVERHIAAPADALYDLVADITRMGEWSPECVEAHWVKGATHAEVGARFKGVNRMGKLSWSTTPAVTRAERGRVFAFKVPGRAGATWTYEFRPADGGTVVTESVSQARPSPLPIRVLQRRMGVTDRSADITRGMQTTLDRLAAAATAD